MGSKAGWCRAHLRAKTSARSSLLGSLLIVAACKGSGGGSDDKVRKAEPEPEPVRVAAASDLAIAFTELGAAFEKKTGQKVSFSFGASGLLARQIAEGAPFDVFAAANASFVDEAVKSGQCLPKSKKIYAQGHLALWAKERAKLPKSIEELKDRKYSKIAIANPEHAPYGQAAAQAMKKAGVWDAAKDRLVYGENVQQALQYAQSGNVDVSVVALSIAMSAGGEYLPLDPALHEPLDQALVLCRGGAGREKPHEAQLFADFVSSAEGRAIMTRYGFLLPEEPPPAK